MSKNTKIKDLNYYIDWLNDSIKEEHIKYYEYSDFNNIQQLGSGSYGNVVRSNWKYSNRFFALKSFNNDKQTLKEVVKELISHRSVDDHENIIRLYGITEVETGATHHMKKYSLVLEYADSGTLNAYFDVHFNELNWNDKLHLALQLANAVEFLHDKGIIHRDLHANNILVHQKNIKLADFGLSKKIAEASSNTSKINGVIPYVDPRSFNNNKNQSQNYKLTKKSDVYSIGVLMWQISSGYEPFKNKGYDYDITLVVAIHDGLREDIIYGTPVEYSNLYTECWKYEPNERPNMQKVVSILKEIVSPGQNEIIDYKVNEEKENHSLEKYKSETSTDINRDLMLDNISNINYYESVTSSQNHTNRVAKSSSIDTYINELRKLEKDGIITPDEKVKKLIKDLTETKFLYTLKLLFEDLQNEFSPKVLIDSLEALANPTLFNYYSKDIAARLELHLRTLVAVLERICFSPIVLSKALQDKVYNSLAEFMEIHHRITQIIETETNNSFSNQKNNEDSKSKKRNYNIDFLLIHLQDTLHSLRDDKTWFQELLRKVRDLLKDFLNITPGILSKASPDDNSILLMLTQLRQDLNFKYSVASYYVDWRIMLIIRHNLFTWSESSEKIISKKFGELVLMEYIWSFLGREWINVDNKSIFQPKFEGVSNKFSKDILWFGILDLAQNLIQKSTRDATYGLCYYLATESLNKASCSIIQFKTIEILLHLHNINNQMFSMIETDFDQYTQKLSENKSTTTDSSESFQNLLTFVKEKYLEDLKILNDDTGKGKEKALCQNTYSKGKQGSNSQNILNIIVDEMTCPVSSEPTDQLCILKCQHMLSLNSLKKLKQKICPKCREKIEDDDIKYLSQNTIYKSLYSQFFEAGYILPELEDSEQVNNQCDNDSDNSEVDHILAKKKKFIKAIKLNSNILLSSIFPKFSRKQHPTYQNVIKELEEKNYAKAEYWCKEFLKTFPKSYSMRCILAYIYRCLNNYKQAHLYLDEAIDLKEKNPIAYFIRGEIFFRQNECAESIECLEKSLSYKAKINKLYVILGNCYLKGDYYDCYDIGYALENYNIALQNDPNNYLCLKNCAYIYEEKGRKYYLNTLKMLDKLLSINEKDSLILCYYGEILSIIGKYSNAMSYFTKANIIDPENVHNLNKRAIAYYVLQEYDKALLDLNKVIQLDPLNSLAYYYKGLTYYTLKNIGNAIVAFKKCIELDPDDKLSKMQLYYLECLQDKNSYKNLVIKKINQISNINDDKSLLIIRCKIYIKLRDYEKAKSDLDRLFKFYGTDISFINLLREYSDFWSYLYKDRRINFTETGIGIVNIFNQFMYKEFSVYFISNLTNLDNKFCQFQKKDSNSLSGQVLSFKGKVPKLNLPIILNIHCIYCYIIWKIKVKKISKDCFIKFMMVKHSHVLDYDDILKLEGLGWIEYKLPNLLYLWRGTAQHSIEINGSIDMQIDYVRYVRKESYNEEEEIYFPKMGHLLPIHKICQNVPEAFKDKYFSRKEMDNLLELKDII